MKKSLLLGASIGIALALSAIAVTRVTGYVFGWEMVLLWPAVIPFASSDPEGEATYLALSFAILLNGLVFALVAQTAHAAVRRFAGDRRSAV